MIYTSPSDTAVSALVEILRDPENGLNAHLEAACGAKGIDIRQFDLSDDSGSFYRANVDVSTLRTVGIDSYPLMAVYSLGADNAVLERPSTFSGTVPVVVDAWLSWLDIEHNMSALTYAYEGALLNTVNRLEGNYGEVGWSGRFQFGIGPIYGIEGEGLVQQISAVLNFRVRV